MSVEEVVNGFIPLSIELLEGGGIPPILIELSMVKFGDLGEEVGEAFKG